MKSVLAITDDTVLATSIIVNALQELGNEYVGNCGSQIITQAFSLSKFFMPSHGLFYFMPSHGLFYSTLHNLIFSSTGLCILHFILKAEGVN